MAAERDDEGRSGGWLEVAIFVKHVVGGEEALASDLLDLAMAAEGGGVEGAAAVGRGVGDDRADERRAVADLGGDGGEAGFDVGHKAALEQQVARRVAADNEFGVNHEFGPLIDEGAVGVEDFAAVAREVADDGVYLGQADAHVGEGCQHCGPTGV